MHIDALSVLCAQLTRDLLAIAKFLFLHVSTFVIMENKAKMLFWRFRVRYV